MGLEPPLVNILRDEMRLASPGMLQLGAEEDFVETLRTNISINQQNLCLISGFMCALAGAMYTNEAHEGLCFGEAGARLTLE